MLYDNYKRQIWENAILLMTQYVNNDRSIDTM